MELGKLGTKDGAYYPIWNPLLNANVTTLPYGYHMNPMTFAMPIPAARVAQLFGGKIVQDPMTARFWCTAVALAVTFNVKMADGSEQPRTVNVGYILNVLGNDIAFANARAKSRAICEELLQMDWIDWEMADKLYAAIEPSIP